MILYSFRCGLPNWQPASTDSAQPSDSNHLHAESHAILLKRGCSRRDGISLLTACLMIVRARKAMVLPWITFGSFLLKPFGRRYDLTAGWQAGEKLVQGGARSMDLNLFWSNMNKHHSSNLTLDKLYLLDHVMSNTGATVIPNDAMLSETAPIPPKTSTKSKTKGLSLSGSIFPGSPSSASCSRSSPR